MKRPSRQRSSEFEVISHGWSYRNREDKTNLPPNTLITGSQNVLTNTSGRVGVRKGYTLDGAANTSISSIKASFDWFTSKGYERNMRAGFLTSAANDGKLQYRYVTSAGVVSWRDLVTSLSSTSFNFTEFWDFTTEKINLCLFVNGGTLVYEWSGAVTTIASVGTNTLTKSGTSTWAAEGFYVAGTRKVTIGGVDYTYTGGESTTTLTGVTPDPALSSIVAGDIVHQTPRTTALASFSSGPATGFTFDGIATLRNQVYYGCLTQNSVYVSKVNDYDDCSFATPRVVGEGARLDLGGAWVGFQPQEDLMYVTAGEDQWYQTSFQLSSDNAKEILTVNLLKTSSKQAAQSQAFITKVKNNVVFLSNEPVINTLGRVQNILQDPNIVDISWSIVNDMDDYDFSSGSMKFHKNFLYVAVPAEGRVLIYNMTDENRDANGNHRYFWESPQVLPISCFSIIDGDLYGHSFNSSETYKLFDGYNDNGNFVEAKAMFAFNNHGSRSSSKGFNRFFVEGYISSNTTLTVEYQFDLDGCATTISNTIEGTDTRIVCIGSDDNSLGKESLGKNPLGGDYAQVTSTTLPPKFRVILTNVKIPYYEYSPTFRTNGLDQNFEILAFGPATSPTFENSANITK